jgi:putative ABC transport system permease protein
MRRVRGWLSRLSGIFGRQRQERELAAEMESHLQMHIEDKLRAGMSADEARRQALIKLGGLEQTKENYRDRRGLPVLENLLQDFRYGVRMLRASPGFTAVAILTLALGMGANAAIFSVVNAILLRPLPYPEPERLVRVWESAPTKGAFRNVVNPLNFLDWRDHSRSFESMAAILDLMTNLSANGEPVAVQGLQVSPQFFSILRVPPLLGRTFTSEDGVAGHHQVVIISYELWQRQFGANPQIIGQKMDVDAVPFTVIGVMPRSFSFPKTHSEVWTPLPLARSEDWKSGRYLTVVARLKPGVTLEQAREDMLSVANLAAEARPDFNKGWSAEVMPMLEDVTRGVRRPLWVLLAAVGFLLLIACANLANLLLMRGTGRLREMAVRSALGAARSRIIQQLFVESLLLSLAGTAAGLLFAQLGLRSLLALIPQNAPLPRNETIVIDERVLLFTFLASLFTALIFGFVPALRLSRVDLQSALKQGSLRGGVGGHQTLRRCFVVAEVALALLLSVGAGLMLRSFSRLISVDPGFSPEHLLTMHIWTSPARYHDNLKRSQYFDRILSEIRRSPGVRAAGSTHFLPLTEKISGSCFSPADQPAPTPAQSPSAQFLIISSDYFRAMGTPILKGRDFDVPDNFNSQPVAIVNHAFAERYFPGQDIFAKQLRVCWTIEKPVAIVGVAADARQAQLQQVPTPTIFLSNSQAPMYFATLVVRATGDPRQIARSAEVAIHRVDPDQAISDIQTMETVFSDSVSSPRFQAILLLVFAGLAVALAMIGVYGIVSYSVSQRTNEIGIRVAMGARSSDIVRLVLREALALSGIALGLGLAGSLALSRVLQTLLFEVTPTDPVTFASVCCLVLVVSALAAVWPARRAVRVDPLVALRYE